MAQRSVSRPVSLRLPSVLAANLKAHLFPGDSDEHGAVIGAAVVNTSRGCRLLGRRLFLAEDGVNYIPGNYGYRMLTADFVLICALACANEGLAYLAVHNHPGEDSVAFSYVDMESHRRGYPALVDILNGPLVGGIVFAQEAVAGDIWVSTNLQVKLDHAVVTGHSQVLQYPSPRRYRSTEKKYDRQVRLFGDRGQEILATQKVAIIGAGGAGSLINEYLSRLGVGHLIMVDFDRLDSTNCPRVVGTRPSDLDLWPRLGRLSRLLHQRPSYKANIAKRVAREANPKIHYESIVEDITQPTAAERLIDCDAIFLAADSMRARLLVNAVCHQFLIPTWQVGAKVTIDPAGAVQDVFSAVRHLVPGQSCLWCNQLIDRTKLAEEAVSPAQRDTQRYVEDVPAPSVITLNAVACAHAVDQFMFTTLQLQEMPEELYWLKYRATTPYPTIEMPRRDKGCSECQGRLGAGRLKKLPIQEA